MTKGRIAIHIISSGIAFLAFWATIILIVLTLLSVVGWNAVFISLGVMIVSGIVAVINFVTIASNMDETFETKGIFGKFLN